MIQPATSDGCRRFLELRHPLKLAQALHRGETGGFPALKQLAAQELDWLSVKLFSLACRVGSGAADRAVALPAPPQRSGTIRR